MGMTKNCLLHLMGRTDFMDQCQDFSFSELQILVQNAPAPDTLYLTTDSSVSPKPHILRVSSPSQINEAFRFHQRYLHWREQSLRYAHIEHDLYTLLDISAAFLGWDIWIISPDYRMEAGSTNHFPGHLDQHRTMSQSELETLYHDNPEFDQTYQQKGIQAYPQYQIEGGKLYYFNLFQETLYLGRLLILIPDHHENPGGMHLMSHLCDDVESCYRFLYLRRRQEDISYRFYDLWKAVLENQTLDPDVANSALSQMGWQANDEYQILYLVPAGYFYSQQTLKYYAVQLETTFPGCIAAELNEGLYCLRNLRADDPPNFRQKLSEFLRENLFRVGISNSFRDFFDSRRYRLQAEDAMRFGQRKDPSIWRYDFCDYVGEYALSQCLAQYTARDLCPKNLQILLDYDQAHPGGELMETLYQYYACQFNAQLAAQNLFIHRTTFFYRMNKIQKIAAFHPEDPAETCQIMLAFQALKHSITEP